MDDATGLCRGCWRTLDEIARWSAMSDRDKHSVIVMLEQRKKIKMGSDPGG